MGRPEMSAKEAYERFKYALVDDTDICKYIEKYGTEDVPELKTKHLLGSLKYYFGQVTGHADFFLKHYDTEELLMQAKHIQDAYDVTINIDEISKLAFELDDMQTEVKNELKNIAKQKQLFYAKCEADCGHEFIKESEYDYKAIGGKRHYLVCKKCGLKLNGK